MNTSKQAVLSTLQHLCSDHRREIDTTCVKGLRNLRQVVHEKCRHLWRRTRVTVLVDRRWPYPLM